MVTEADLAAVMATAFAHCQEGGIAVFVPDVTKEQADLASGVECGGSDGPDGAGVRYLEWTYDSDPDDSWATTVYSFVFREADGTVGALTESHTFGIFPRATWTRLLAEQGFVAEVVTERTQEDRTPRLMFLGHRPR
jgi:hypothetical protein